MPIVSVPANLLLIGEYAVLEEDGLGITIAAEKRVTASLTDALRLTIGGEMRGQRSEWPDGDADSLINCVLRASASVLHVSVDSLCSLPLRIDVDSSAFYDSRGGKTGFGSSAAVAVAICFAILDYTAPRSVDADSPTAPVPGRVLDAVFSAALEAHREFQNGHGSGYDIAASVYGRIGRFEGGAHPRFRRITIPWLPPFTVFRGATAVHTPRAVARYHAWKQTHAQEAREFIRESNRCGEGFLAATSWPEAKPWFDASRELGFTLGAAIGISAEVEPPAALRGYRTKALGAGNELGIAFPPDGDSKVHPFPLEYPPIEIAGEGVKKEFEEDGRSHVC